MVSSLPAQHWYNRLVYPFLSSLPSLDIFYMKVFVLFHIKHSLRVGIFPEYSGNNPLSKPERKWSFSPESPHPSLPSHLLPPWSSYASLWNVVSVLVHPSFRHVTVFRISRHSIARGFFQLQIIFYLALLSTKLFAVIFLISVIIPGISSITPNLPGIVCWVMKTNTHSWLLTYTQPFQISPEGEWMTCWKTGPKRTHVGWSVWYGNYCLSLDLRQLGEKKKPWWTLWCFVTLQVFRLGNWYIYISFFQSKNGSALLKSVPYFG